MNVIELIERGELAVIKCMSCSEGHRLRNYVKAETGELLRLARLGQAMQWVSVKDNGHPETEGHYWIYESYRGWQMKGKWKNNKWDILSNEPFSALIVVTHWMPLPPAPVVKL